MAAVIERLQDKFLKRGIPFKAGKVEGFIYGGPYDAFKATPGVVGVKMAVEINKTCDINIPTEDYKVPDEDTMRDGVDEAILALASGKNLYVGCMGGVGRTGTFMALMRRIETTYKGEYDVEEGVESAKEAIAYVRAEYNEHAVERPIQVEFIEDFDINPALLALRLLNNKRVLAQKAVQRLPKPSFIDVTLAFAKALAAFLPALIAFLSHLKRK